MRTWDVRHRRVAASLPELSTAHTYRQAADVVDMCNRFYNCEVNIGHHPVADDVPARRPSGIAVTLTLLQRDLHTRTAPALLQISMKREAKPDMQSVSQARPTKSLGTTKWGNLTFQNQLRLPWMIDAQRGTGKGSGLFVHTYLVTQNHQQAAQIPRTTMLTDSPNSWTASLAALWQDVLDPNHIVEFAVVTPTPTTSAGDRGQGAHILVIQQSKPTEVAILLTALTREGYVHWATFVPEHATKAQLNQAISRCPYLGIHSARDPAHNPDPKWNRDLAPTSEETSPGINTPRRAPAARRKPKG